jgi:hypothetical protein
MPSCCCSVVLLGKFLYCKLQLLLISENLYPVVVGLDGWDFVAQGGKERCLFVYGLEFCAIYAIGSCLEDFSFSLLHFFCLLKVVTHFRLLIITMI